MKKLTAILCAMFCLVMGTCAFAETTVKPMLPTVQLNPADLANRDFNIRPVPMENDASMKMFLYTPVLFTQESIAALQVGDALDLYGRSVTIESLRMDGEDYVINDADTSTGFYLHPTEEDHQIFAVHTLEDDYTIQYCVGLTEAVFAADFQFKDFRDIELEEPVIGDLAAFKAAGETAYFNEDNLTVFFNDKGEISLLCLYPSPNS